jgi:peptidoglycan/LPS O-acetylase OafA/YrhL
MKNYFPGIDGLRAIAASVVILFHLIPISILHLGWTGVDLFFCISGFLITSILIKNKGHEHFLKNFYIRRALRIFPLYYLILIPLLLLTVSLSRSYNFTNVISYIFYLQNFTAISDGYLFGLGHTWSLAVEEQYYILFPFIVYFIPMRYLTKTLIILITLAVSLRFYLAQNYTEIYYQSTIIFTRADSILMGGLLPCLYFNDTRLNKSLVRRVSISFLLIGFILLSVFFVWQYNNISHSNLFLNFGNTNLKNNSIGQFKYTILALIFSGFIGIIAYSKSKFISQLIIFLEVKPLKYLGTISYGLYIYHFPIQVICESLFIKLGLSIPMFIALIIKLLLTFIISHLSFRYVEKPILSLKQKFEY